jgi:hypothetical protein
MAFMFLLLLQLANSFINYQSVVLIGLGGLTYLVPLAAVFTGYYFAIRIGNSGIYRFFRGYAILCLLSTLGIYLEYFGLDYTMLGEIGSGLVIYDVGTILKAYSGFFRASEIAAWHIFFGSCLMIMLAMKSTSLSLRAIWVAGVVFLVVAGMLTGRRKLIITILIFAFCYWFFVLAYLKSTLRIAVVLLLLGVVSLGALSQNRFIQQGGDAVFDLYVERSSSVFSDISSRVNTLGINSIRSAIDQFGLFGRGAGAFSQGARFSNVKQERAWQVEGGFGRIVAELGLVGLLILLWLFYLMLIYFRRLMMYLSRKNSELAITCFGLIAILIANMSHFFVASQVFSDPFILILLGLVTGMIIALPVIMKFEEAGSTMMPIPAPL